MKIAKQEKWVYWFLAILVLLLIVIFAYGLKIHRYGFLEDDWLTIFVAKEIGRGSLVYHYSFDRPIRGYFALALSTIFREKMLLYQITGLVFRLFSAIFIMASLNLIWEKRKTANFLIACLMLVYPGFFEQPHAFDYLAHFFAFFCMTFSIYLTILFFTIKKPVWKVVLTITAVAAAFASYGVNDYFIGLEGLRMGMVFLFLYQKRESLKTWLRTFILIEAVYLLPGLLYSIWRIFFFESKRTTTDAAVMLSPFQENPFQSILSLLLKIAENAFRVIFGAWFNPIRQTLKNMTTLEIITGILLGAVIAASMFFVIRYYRKNHEKSGKENPYAIMLILLGLFSVICSLVPIVFGMRFVDYYSYNRFSFPGSIGACMIVIGLLTLVPVTVIRYGVTFILIIFSITMQYGNGLVYEDNYNATVNLWHQLSWRAPAIQSGTLISGQIKAYSANEPYTFWSPANLIYFSGYHEVLITAEILNEETLQLMQNGVTFSTGERGIPFTKEYGHLLLLDRPTLNSCLHVIDGRYPELSASSSELMRAAAPYSVIDGITPAAAQTAVLDAQLFHELAPEGWCYLYQKSQLARQLNDWDAVYQNGLQALDQGLTTADDVEWMPYVQAFAYVDDIQRFNLAAEHITGNAFLREQACQVFTSYAASGSTVDYEEGNELLLQTFCD